MAVSQSHSPESQIISLATRQQQTKPVPAVSFQPQPVQQRDIAISTPVTHTEAPVQTQVSLNLVPRAA